MKFTELFLRRPTLVFVLIALVSLAGFLALRSLVQQQFPNVIQPTLTITANYSGAPSTVMRDDVVMPIEDQLAGTPDLIRINSVVQSGTARVSAIFDLNSQISTDLSNTMKAVQAAQKQLPTQMLAPTIAINDPAQATVVTVEVSSSTLTLSQLSMLAINRIAPSIQQVPGISLVTENGTVTPSFEVLVHPNQLESAGLTLNDVFNTVAADNNRDPGGIVYGKNRETQVDIRGDIQTPSSIAELPISPPANAQLLNGMPGLAGVVNPWTAGNQVRRMHDVASVTDANEPQRMYAEVSGQTSIFLSIQKTDQASEVDASDNVIKALPQLEREYPEVTFKVVNIQSRFTKQQIESVTRTLAEGIILTGLVMLFFLGSWRNAIVVLVAIPTSLCVSLFVMNLMNLTLDTISLLGMTLVIGILVDDSTVTLENIERHFHLGETPYNAALKGRSEIGMAAIVITLVDVVVFLPIAFMPGQVGRQLQEFGVVVAIATLTSLFVSFTVTPTLAGLWGLKGKWKPFGIIRAFLAGFERATQFYADHILTWALKHRVTVVSVAALSFVGSVLLVPLGVIGEEYIPPEDRGEIYIQMAFPSGTPLLTAQAAAVKVERVIDQNPDLSADTTVSGFYAAPFGGFVTQGNVGQVHVFLRDNRKHSTDWWVARYKQTIPQLVPGAQTTVVPVTNVNGGNSQPIDLLVTDLSGGDPTEAARKVTALLATIPGAVNVNSTAAQLSPQIAVQFDRAKARALNVDIGAASTAAEAAFGGAIATQFETTLGLMQVQVIYPMDNQHELEELANVPVRANNGSVVHLGDFATFQQEPTPPLITRADRFNVVHVNANIDPSTSLSQVLAALNKKVPSLHLPSNIVLRPAPFGQQDFMNQTLAGIGASLVLSVILVFLLMVALYNSYISPFIIMFAVPLAAVGAIGSLLITHETLNLFSLIGTVLLVGIATKNGILLVDYANTLRAHGMDKLAAIRESARTRFRPIVMTSVSIIAGNIPLALALEPGSSVRSSLGVVICGGALSSLALTLLVVPIMYLWIAPNEVPLSNAVGTNGAAHTNGGAHGNGHSNGTPVHVGA